MNDAHARMMARLERAADDEERDLHSQLEDLFHAVWIAERDWMLLDRVDLALKRDPNDR
jgi:hypothetical protein